LLDEAAPVDRACSFRFEAHTIRTSLETIDLLV